MSTQLNPTGTHSDNCKFIRRETRRKSLWLCLRCNTQFIASHYNVTHGHTKSCGCIRREMAASMNRTHGQSRSRIYQVWCGMNRRCCDQAERHRHWAGRGITVCERWRDSFAAFLEDMGPGKKGWTIERVKNDGNYELSNCVWATRVRQGRNKRNNHVVTVRGVTGCLSELAERFGVSYRIVIGRLRRKWEVEDAFFKPVRRFVKASSQQPPLPGI